MGLKIKKFKRSSAFFIAAALCLGSTSGVYAMDENELSRIIEEAKNTDTSGYTPESCESLQAALEGAENLLAKEDVTEEELGAGGMMLQAILENGLVAQADKSSLEAVLSEAAAYTDSTQDGYEVLDQVRIQAQAVLEDGNATQAETDGAASAVAQAEENLGGGIDKTVLSDLITQAEAVDTSGSDDASVQQLKTAIASAKQVAANPSATQSLVDKHIQLLQAAAEALYQKTDPDTVYDGVYQIGGLLHHATADQVSMGNSALVKPFQLIKKGNDIHLRIECTSLTTKLGKQDFTGYLASMWYYPGFTSEDTLPYGAAEEGRAVDNGEAQNAAEIEAEDQEEAQRAETEAAAESSQAQAEDSEGQEAAQEEDELFMDGEEASGDNDSAETGEEDPAAQAETQTLDVNEAPAAEAATAKAVGVESYYDVYDSYNDPKKGTDATVKGKKYPHYITIPVELNQSIVWTRIYVPVMEAINAGGGKQYAKLYLDWNDLKQVSGTETDKAALKKQITNAQNVQKSLKQDSQGYAGEQLTMLANAIAAAQAVYKNMNIDQTVVDNEVKALTMAVNAVTRVKVDSDKSELKKAIETADSYLNETDVEYEASTREALQRARDKASLVYDNEEASQTEVNKCVTAMDNAIQGLIIQGTDRREIKKALTKAETYLKDTAHYTAADMDVLRSVYETAKTVYENKESSQEETDAQTGILDYVMKNMKKASQTEVDKTGLQEMLLTASNMAGREDTYTAATLKTLNSAITAAKKVYDNGNATQSQVNTQIKKLSKAVSGLKKKSSGSSSNSSINNGNNSSNNSNNGNNNNNSNHNGSNSSLDVKNLADGVYSVTGSMVKIDKTSASMSNEAINHTIKLTVKNGKYSITMDFKGLTINSQLGYLGTLKYFKTGYKLDKYGSPSGSLGNVTVDSYQKYTNGKLVTDNFGTNYPDVVTFPLIEEAKSDGYVPLQVFVPIMDSITKGTGTQPAFLKLDWSTLKKTDSKDSDFNGDNNNGDGSNSSNNGTNSSGNGSLSGNNGSLSTNSNGSLSGSGSKLGSNGSLSGSTSKSGGSSLKNSGSLKSSGTTTKSTSTKKSAGTTALKSGKSIGSKSDSKNTGTTKLTSSGLSDAADQDQETTTSGEAYADTETSTSTEESSGNMRKVAVPVSVSALAALAGVFYKIKSRGGSLRKKAGKKK